MPERSLNQKASDLLGERLMSDVRDHEIQFWDEFLVGQTRYYNYRKIYEGLRQSLEAEQLEAVRDLIPYVVDNVIANFLGMLENVEFEVAVHVEGGTVPSLDDVTDGLETALYGEEGWIVRYSKKGYDPFGLEKDQ